MSTNPKRIQRQRTKGWKMPEGAVYVGRPGKFGNYHTVGDPCIPDAAAAVEAYANEILQGVLHSEQIRNDVMSLRGKDLACWCPLDQPCHADVLLRLANQGDDMEAKPQSFAAEWESYLKAVIPAGAGETQKRECRRAFYAGAWAFLNLTQAIMDPGDEPTDGDMDRFSLLVAELEGFHLAVKSGEA